MTLEEKLLHFFPSVSWLLKSLLMVFYLFYIEWIIPKIIFGPKKLDVIVFEAEKVESDSITVTPSRYSFF